MEQISFKKAFDVGLENGSIAIKKYIQFIEDYYQKVLSANKELTSLNPININNDGVELDEFGEEMY